MTASATLADAVMTAVAELLADRAEIAIEAVEPALPMHIRLGRPTKKLVKDAVTAAGWRLFTLRDKSKVYRAPQLQSDPLRRHGEAGDNISAEQLRQFIERVERLDEEIKCLSDDRKDVFAEAKSTGFDAKTMRVIIGMRKKDKHLLDEEEALLETYRAALGMA